MLVLVLVFKINTLALEVLAIRTNNWYKTNKWYNQIKLQ